MRGRPGVRQHQRANVRKNKNSSFSMGLPEIFFEIFSVNNTEE